MNLLKVLMLMTCAAALCLILPGHAKAVDHPWDDHTLDSSMVNGELHGTVPTPPVERPLIQRIVNWWRQILRDAHDILWGGPTKNEVKGITVQVDKGKVESPYKPKKP